MKKVLSVIAVGLFLFAQTGFTAPIVYTVSARVPASSSVGVTAYSVNSTTNNRTALSGTSLDFTPLVYSPTNGIYLPDHYFIIESILANGAGNQDVTVAYAEVSNPNAPNHGLGWKTVATFNKAVGTTETQISGHPKKLLKDVTAEHITGAELGNAVLRLYVGVVTGNPSLGEPAGAEVITNSDKQGDYSGTLTVTATVV